MELSRLAVFLLLIEVFITVYAHVGYHPPGGSSDQNRYDGHDYSNHDCTSSFCPEHLHSSNVHTILCNEFNVTTAWSKSAFRGDEYDVKLLDNTCNNFKQNRTTVWITSDFGTCGSTIIEHRNVIIQKNTAFLTVRNITGSIAREHIYKYNLQCLFQRKNNASTDYKVVQGIKKTVELAAESAFDISINIFTSSSFLIKSIHPITVSMNQPIFVGIKKVNTNGNFKMIVEQCFATPTPSTKGMKYVFFDNRCSLDSSFRMIQNDDHKFSFVIKTFRFVKTSKSIYIHCRAYICQKKSKSSQCEQKCGGRRNARNRVTRGIKIQNQNELFNNIEIKEIQNITTTRIVLVEKKTCNDLSCPINSQCFELYPAVCRCNSGLVFSSEKESCIDKRILRLIGLHLKTRWVYTYANNTSHDFLSLATNIEKKLRNVFLRVQVSQHIEGIKVISAKESNGVAINVHLVHKESTTVEETSNKLINLFTNKETSVLSIFHQNNIKSDPVPSIESDSSGTVRKIYFVSTAAPVRRAQTPITQKKITDPPTTKNVKTTKVIVSTSKPTSKVITTGKPMQEQRVTTPKPIIRTVILQTKQPAQKVDTQAARPVSPKLALVTTQVTPCLLNSTRTHPRITTYCPPYNGSLTKETIIVVTGENTLTITIILSISFVLVLIVTILLCHYKRNIYYHVLTW